MDGGLQSVCVTTSLCSFYHGLEKRPEHYKSTTTRTKQPTKCNINRNLRHSTLASTSFDICFTKQLFEWITLNVDHCTRYCTFHLSLCLYFSLSKRILYSWSLSNAILLTSNTRIKWHWYLIFYFVGLHAEYSFNFPCLKNEKNNALVNDRLYNSIHLLWITTSPYVSIKTKKIWKREIDLVWHFQLMNSFH